MIHNKYVDEYIKQIKNHPEQFNQDRKELVNYLEDKVLSRDDIYFDERKINAFKKWTEKFFFPLQPFQMFIITFVFLYHKDTNDTVFSSFFFTLARGGGKNGLISALVSFLISELHGIKHYDVTVVANSEKQAKTSFHDVYHALQEGGLQNTAEHPGLFEVYKSRIVNIETQSKFEFATSNANTKDGGREGAVIFDEIHQFENSEIVDVFTSGLGKTDNPRRFFIGTNGYIREGYYDNLINQARDIWETHDNPQELFPFICLLDDASEVDDYDKWQKAQPMFAEPMGQYGAQLFRTYKKAYLAIPNEPSSRQEFMTKRMNLPEINLEEDVASKEEVMATNQSIPFDELEGCDCIGGVDFASIRDFTAVGILFKQHEKMYWVTHSFARKEYLDKANLKPPIKEWAKQGLLTIVDEPSISPQHVVDWFVEQSKRYNIRKIEIDSYKQDLIAPLLEEAGFEVEIIRRPSSIHPRLAPMVEDGFAKHNIVFGNNPLMRWYTNNVLVKTLKDGGKQYLKKDEHRRKTDGFQAFLHALSRVNEVEDGNLEDEMNALMSFF